MSKVMVKVTKKCKKEFLDNKSRTLLGKIVTYNEKIPVDY